VTGLGALGGSVSAFGLRVAGVPTGLGLGVLAGVGSGRGVGFAAGFGIARPVATGAGAGSLGAPAAVGSRSVGS